MGYWCFLHPVQILFFLEFGEGQFYALTKYVCNLLSGNNQMLLLLVSFAFSYEVYKNCTHMRFCRENINLTGQWTLKHPRFNKDNNEFTGNLYNNDINDELQLVIYRMQENSFRIQAIPLNREDFSRYNTSGNPLVINQSIINQHLQLSVSSNENQYILKSPDCQAEIQLSPFSITITDKYNSTIYLNANQGLVFEHKNQAVEPDLWPYYQNDTIIHGATAVGIDFSFKGKNTRLTGFPEADESINLIDTSEEPKRVTNVDYYSMYGHVPLVYGHSATQMLSFFWINPTDTFLKIQTDEANDRRNIRVLSEGGFLDIVVFTGKINTLIESYTDLTGKPDIPPMFTLGYHQSKWGYKNQTMVENVIDQLDANDFPVDVMWLDVDHLYNHGPFRFNRTAFPNPDELFKKLADRNRYLVRLNDPHIPTDETFPIYVEARDKNYFVRNSDGETQFKGHCWPGQSSWPDFLNPTVRDWWAKLYQYEANETAPNVYFWNDMNEPSIFNIVEGTFPKDLLFYNDYEEREIRSLYGLLMHSATYQGVINRYEDHNTRAFLLTRSWFAGSQKFTWQWSGDNTANFQMLHNSISMSIVTGLCGMPLTGADLGGFNGNTWDQLFYRWYQTGVLAYPLYRNHCHEDSEHREPYLFDNHTQNLVRNATKLRYQLAPLWYTALQTNHETGIPPVLPLFALYPEIDELHDVDDQFILGQSLMGAPITVEDTRTRKVIKPPGKWYDYYTGKEFNETTNIDVTDTSLPIYVRGGTITPMFTKVGSNMDETRASPLMLIVACDEHGEARGPLYIDDGISFNYQNGVYMNRWIVYRNNVITIEVRGEEEKELPEIAKNTYIKEIRFLGVKETPKFIDDALVYCEGEQCTMTGFELYPYQVTSNESKKKSYILYIVIGSVAGAIIIAVIVILVVKKFRGKTDYPDVDKQPATTKESLLA